jgi:hypothetical protein
MDVGIHHVDHVAPSIRKSLHSLRRQAAVARWYSSLEDSGHGVVVCTYWDYEAKFCPVIQMKPTTWTIWVWHPEKEEIIHLSQCLARLWHPPASYSKGTWLSSFRSQPLLLLLTSITAGAWRQVPYTPSWTVEMLPFHKLFLSRVSNPAALSSMTNVQQRATKFLDPAFKTIPLKSRQTAMFLLSML